MYMKLDEMRMKWDKQFVNLTEKRRKKLKPFYL